jgi:hypothetical protein
VRWCFFSLLSRAVGAPLGTTRVPIVLRVCCFIYGFELQARYVSVCVCALQAEPRGSCMRVVSAGGALAYVLRPQQTREPPLGESGKR